MSGPALPSASLPEMEVWARGIMSSRPADYDIGPGYLRRWWVIPRNEWQNVYLREPGAIVQRPAPALHRIELIDGQRALSLFITGPKVREWGFACPQGWVHWAKFTDPTGRAVGKGCDQ